MGRVWAPELGRVWAPEWVLAWAAASVQAWALEWAPAWALGLARVSGQRGWALALGRERALASPRLVQN